MGCETFAVGAMSVSVSSVSSDAQDETPQYGEPSAKCRKCLGQKAFTKTQRLYDQTDQLTSSSQGRLSCGTLMAATFCGLSFLVFGSLAFGVHRRRRRATSEMVSLVTQ